MRDTVLTETPAIFATSVTVVVPGAGGFFRAFIVWVLLEYGVHRAVASDCKPESIDFFMLVKTFSRKVLTEIAIRGGILTPQENVFKETLSATTLAHVITKGE
jgi:hypothetical protein